jgi:hypothetical protein
MNSDDALSASLCKTFWKLPDDYEPDDHDNEMELPGDTIPFLMIKKICEKTFHPAWHAVVVPFLLQGREWFAIPREELVEVMREIPLRVVDGTMGRIVVAGAS